MIPLVPNVSHDIAEKFKTLGFKRQPFTNTANISLAALQAIVIVIPGKFDNELPTDRSLTSSLVNIRVTFSMLLELTGTMHYLHWIHRFAFCDPHSFVAYDSSQLQWHAKSDARPKPFCNAMVQVSTVIIVALFICLQSCPTS